MYESALFVYISSFYVLFFKIFAIKRSIYHNQVHEKVYRNKPLTEEQKKKTRKSEGQEQCMYSFFQKKNT